jgi:calcineurin-like phosphoesterase family protein
VLFFTSDQHWGHENIIKFCDRPFSDVNHMREWLVNKWNETVQPEDFVVVLGDWAMGNREETLKVGLRLNGHKMLVQGNHDDMSKKYTRQTYLDAGFEDIGSIEITDQSILINHNEVVLNHFPYAGDSQMEDRFAEYRPADNGLWLLHGHVHTEWRQRGRQINVGVDAWGGVPVNEYAISHMIEQGPQDLPIIPWVK